jgi:hypothetical protein
MKFYFTALAALVFSAINLPAQTTAFTYQGVLNNGSNAVTGDYDFRFQIYNAGSAVIAKPLTNAPVGVTNGLFTVLLNFETNVFDGSLRTLEIGVRLYNTNVTTNAYAVLSPRQALTSVPYAIQALNASNAVALTAPLSVNNLTGTIPNSQLSGNVAILTNDVTFSGTVTASNFIGSGSGLTNLSTTNLIGTISNAQLSASVALQSNPDLHFVGTVSATNFAGSGHGLTNVPGACIWVTATGAVVQAQSSMGYLCTNDVNPVTIQLPASNSIGDTFRVAGVGGAGWIVAQTNGQVILAGNLSDSVGATWTARESTRNWSAVASSADGTKLAATVKGGQIYLSTNSGATWTPRATSGPSWSSIASSADGTRLVAGVGDNASTAGNIYTSTDCGTTWISRATSQQWVSVASSVNGMKLAAVAYVNGTPGIYTSVIGGTNNWGLHLSGSYGISIASSADGMKLVAAIYTSQIVTSTDAGTNWVARDSARNWTAVASSADGTRLLAAVSGGQLYISSNSGTNWAAVNPLAALSWTAVASSADGSRLVAVASGGEVYLSKDSGATWAQHFGLPTSAWSGVACSADGTKLVLVANSGQIYTSSQVSTTYGTAGYLSGTRLTAIELEYVGNGIFIPLSHEGTIRAY